MSEKWKRLKPVTKSISLLKDIEVDEMFAVYNRYYGEVSKEVFTKDLRDKNDVIILIDKIEGKIKGFSTLMHYNFNLKGKKVRGIFSGDTIIEKEYWGGSALQLAFSKYMIINNLKRPFSPLYWFLISKGYKTYLLMANNFREHYPRFEKDTPSEVKKIMDSFACGLYPQNYDCTSGLIRFEGTHDHLKCDVAPIEKKMLLENPRIKHFSEKNPTWQEGSELVCLARWELHVLYQFALKRIKKSFMKSPIRIKSLVDQILNSFGVRRA